MTGEFSFAVAPYPELDDERKKMLRDIVAAMTPDEITVSQGYDSDDEVHDEDEVQRVREGLMVLVQNYDDLGDRPDTMVFVVAGVRCIVSGGESFGDAPSETYSDIADIGDCDQIFNQLEAWVREDAAKADA